MKTALPIKVFLIIVPFIYSLFLIIMPIYRFDTSYAMSMLLLFWFPSIILFCVNAKWMIRKSWMKSFWITNFVIAVVSFYFEFACLGMKIWDFSEHHHRLVGARIFGAPLEEFMFWFGASFFCILLYIYYYRIIHKELVYPEFPAWALVAIPFIPLTYFLHKQVKKAKVFSWPSFFIVLIIFWLTLSFVEYNSIQKGHWVYNENRILGPKVFNIPIEEYFIYYILGPLFAILLFHFIDLKPRVVLEKLIQTTQKQDY